MPTSKRTDPKHDALRECGTLHARPEEVTDELFLGDDFFDPSDLLQVKYEMLRRVRVEGRPIHQVAESFGFSRPSFYEAQAAFHRAGLSGLLPVKRGPRHAHKLSAPVMDFLTKEIAADPSLRPPALAARLEEKFGISVHPRSIERALGRREKKTP